MGSPLSSVELCISAKPVAWRVRVFALDCVCRALNGACAGPHFLCAEGALRLWYAALPMHVTQSLMSLCCLPLSSVVIFRCPLLLFTVAVSLR